MNRIFAIIEYTDNEELPVNAMVEVILENGLTEFINCPGYTNVPVIYNNVEFYTLKLWLKEYWII